MLRRVTPLVALLLVILVASPANALSLKREWRASVGGGANGTATLEAWTNGTGTLTANLKGLKKNTTYKVTLRKGSCKNPKTVLGKLGTVRTNGSGCGAGLEDDQQRPDGLGVVGADERSPSGSPPASRPSAPSSGTTTRPGSSSRAGTSTLRW